MDEVVYDAEHFFDGFRNNKDVCAQHAFSGPAGRAPTASRSVTRTAACCPTNLSAVFREVKKHMSVRSGVHLHNDSGCAEANSILGILEGAVQVQGTMNGYGERCGNANLCTIIPALQLKRGYAADFARPAQVAYERLDFRQ